MTLLCKGPQVLLGPSQGWEAAPGPAVGRPALPDPEVQWPSLRPGQRQETGSASGHTGVHVSKLARCVSWRALASSSTNVWVLDPVIGNQTVKNEAWHCCKRLGGQQGCWVSGPQTIMETKSPCGEGPGPRGRAGGMTDVSTAPQDQKEPPSKEGWCVPPTLRHCLSVHLFERGKDLSLYSIWRH